MDPDAEPDLVPELLVGDLAASDLCGVAVIYDRPAEDADVVASALVAAGVPLFLEPETTWYRIDDEEAGVRQFLVQDPDGYLVRFQSSIGRRPATAEPA
jgi:hypothetical protein